MTPVLRRTLIALAALPILLIAACAPAIEEPDVRLTGVRIAGLGLQGGLLYAQVEIENPNGFGISAVRVDYDIELSDVDEAGDGWIPLAAGTFTDPIRVDARGTSVIEVPVEFRYAGLGGALRSILETGTFQYRVTGSVSIDQPLRRTVPYRHQGVVSVIRD